MAAAGGLDPTVQAWITKHSDPMYVTDLWFVVKEGESEVRIPACSAILRVTCGLVRDLPEAGDVPSWNLTSKNGVHTSNILTKKGWIDAAW